MPSWRETLSGPVPAPESPHDKRFDLGRVLSAVAAIVGIAVAFPVARSCAREVTMVGDSKVVTIAVRGPGCANPTKVRFRGHDWRSEDQGPRSWGDGTERGRFTIRSRATAVFESLEHGGVVKYLKLDGPQRKVLCLGESPTATTFPR